MRTLILAAVLALHAPTISAEPLAKFGWFADVVGSCWVGVFPDGKTRHSHCYTSQFDQFIRGTATLSTNVDGQWKQQFSGDSLFAWDDAAKRIAYYTWGSDGSHRTHEAHYEGDNLAFPVRSRKTPERIVFRSLWRRVDANSIEVRREVPDGEGWKVELTVLYHRSASP